MEGTVAAAVDPTGAFVYAGNGASGRGVLKLDAASGTVLAFYVDQDAIAMTDLRLAADGSVLALFRTDKVARLTRVSAQVQWLWNDDDAVAGDIVVPGRLAFDGAAVCWTAARTSGDTRVHRTDLATGTRQWSTLVPQPLASALPLVVASGAVQIVGKSQPQVGDSDARLLRFDAATGAALGSHDTATQGSLDQVAYDAVLGASDRILVASNEDHWLRDTALVQALSTVDGSVLWSHAITDGSFYAEAWTVAQRMFAVDPTSGRAYALVEFGFNAAPSTLHALDIATGAELWSVALADAAGAECALSSDGATLYVGAHKGTANSLLHAIDASSGAIRWKLELAPRVGPGQRHVVLGVEGSNDVIHGWSDDTGARLQRRRAADGALVWAHVPVTATGQPVFALDDAATGALGRRVALKCTAPLLSATDRFESVDTATGLLQWHVEVPAVGLLSGELQFDRDERRVACLDVDLSSGSPHLRVLDASTGQLDVDAPVPPIGGTARTIRWDATSSKLYVGANPGASTQATAVFAASGAELWHARYGSGVMQPFAADTCVLVPDPDGKRLYQIGSSPLAATGSDVVVLAYDLPALVGIPAEISLSSGGAQDFDLAPGAAHALDFALLLGTASGTAPGLAIGSLLLPLNPDAYFQFALANPNSGVLPDSLGQLSTIAHRSARFVLPPASDPALVGLVAHHAYVVIDKTTLAVELASNEVAVGFVP
ncbi:MAG: hypothetical protein EPO68_00690 [Planctomycetota bacterium]|nr:MAG: hypothetical protein EPO68_00690 [Planctomycetota bacterium]